MPAEQKCYTIYTILTILTILTISPFQEDQAPAGGAEGSHHEVPQEVPQGRRLQHRELPQVTVGSSQHFVTTFRPNISSQYFVHNRRPAPPPRPGTAWRGRWGRRWWRPISGPRATRSPRSSAASLSSPRRRSASSSSPARTTSPSCSPAGGRTCISWIFHNYFLGVKSVFRGCFKCISWTSVF